MRAEVEEGKRERERMEKEVEELKKEVAGKADDVQGKTKMIAKVCPGGCTSKGLPWVCCVALLCCLFDLACFFLLHISFKNMYIYTCMNTSF